MGTMNKYKLPSTDMYYPNYVLNIRYLGHKMTAQCPFHDDKVNSLSINEAGYWHCFACNEKGSMIDFEMKINNRTFKEALKELGAY